MQTMHSGGLILGGNCGSLIVAGVKEKHSNNVQGVVRLLATSLHKKIIDEETKKYYPQTVVIEAPPPSPCFPTPTIAHPSHSPSLLVPLQGPEEVKVATLEQVQTATIDHVAEKETVSVQGETGVVEEAALATQNTVETLKYATAGEPVTVV
jgi:hypothetical protein